METTKEKRKCANCGIWFESEFSFVSYCSKKICRKAENNTLLKSKERKRIKALEKIVKDQTEIIAGLKRILNKYQKDL